MAVNFMSDRKAELRDVILDIVLGKEKVAYEASQFDHLKLGVAQVLGKRAGQAGLGSKFSPELRLNDSDTMLVAEIFWDLIVEKILTIGLDPENPQYPWFRLHSEAEINLQRAPQ